MANLLKAVKTQVRQYARETTVNTFICDMWNVCNNAGYYADDPKETKKFWLTFTLDCIDGKDYQFICSIANLINSKIK